MSSVAICPHCYLQLAIPDHASPDAEVECPSCHTEFGLEKATVRAIPQGMVKERTSAAPALDTTPDVISLASRKPTEAAPHAESAPLTESAELRIETAKHADADIAAWFRSNKTVPEVPPIAADAVKTTPDDDFLDSSLLNLKVEDKVEDDAVEDDAVTNAEDFTPVDEELDEPTTELTIEPIAAAQEGLPPTTPVPPAAPAGNVTLADWQALRPDTTTQGIGRPTTFASKLTMPEAAAADESPELELESDSLAAELPGPSFDLPDVPLMPNSGATIELGSDQFKEAIAGADFELDDVELDSSHAEWAGAELDSAAEHLEPAHDPNAQTMEEVGLFDGRLREASYEDSLHNAAEEPATDPYEHSTSFDSQDHGGRSHDLPVSLPTRRGGRKRSALRTVVGAVAAAPVGLAIGYFALLWLKGPQADVLEIAKYIPPKFLPPSFSSAATRDETAVASRPAVIAESTPEPVEPPAKESETIPASYVTPVKPAAEKQATDESDRYATQSAPTMAKPDDVTPIGDAPREEPRSFSAPTAGSLTGDEIHIMGAPLFTITEFAAALAKARKAESGLVTGDLSDPAVRKVKGFSYKELCDLAQIVTFCDDASAADRLTQIEHDSTDLFQRVLATPHTRDEVAQIANIWIDSTYRKHGGIFLSGKIHGGEIAGDMYEYGLSTEAGGELKILVPKPLDTHLAADGKSVGIVGSIIDQPAQKISGYTGNSPRVIWVRDVIPLD
jgi:hypothetical protein